MIGTGALIGAGCVPEDPQTSKLDFPASMAEAVCRWMATCCDAAEQTGMPGGGIDASTCASQLTTQYRTLFNDAEASRWDANAARELVDSVLEAAGSCPRAYDPADDLGQRELVTPTKQPGDMCTSTWDCSTKFCKSGVCANPLPAGSTCSSGEPCATGLRCIKGLCSELQPDGAVCTIGAECYSGACGGGKCVVLSTYTCDGK